MNNKGIGSGFSIIIILIMISQITRTGMMLKQTQRVVQMVITPSLLPMIIMEFRLLLQQQQVVQVVVTMVAAMLVVDFNNRY